LQIGAEIRLDEQVVQFLGDVMQVKQYFVLHAAQFAYKPSS